MLSILDCVIMKKDKDKNATRRINVKWSECLYHLPMIVEMRTDKEKMELKKNAMKL